MARLITGYEYDIFISYRQKDNKGDRWVSEFVEALKTELESTFKEEISVYFDINPHDGLLETHDVDASLKEKLKCLIFIPIISRTYCDPKSFAWEHEFKAFVELASRDQFGLKVKLPNGNVASRVLPVRIHDLDAADIKECESLLGIVLRGIEFIYKESGFNRPLKPYDDEKINLNKTKYRNQIAKVALAIKDIITAIEHPGQKTEGILKEVVNVKPEKAKKLIPKTIVASFIIFALIALGYFFFPKIFITSKQIEKSIAVLPFLNDSQNDSTTYFMDGVMEEILTNLQTVKDLRVISRTSVEQYRNQTKSIPEIARELGVNYIVEGSGQKYGSSFRLRVQLIMAKHESHLWGESFQQKITEVGDIFNIQIRIAESIANELKVVISPEERKLIEKIPSADLEVYDKYLKARSYLTNFTQESANKALEYLNSAVEKNPDWAPLYAGLAELWTWIQQAGWELPSVAGPKILENLNKAKELDPDLAEVHYQSAVITQLVEWNWEKSEKEFLKALAINPNNALYRLMYAQLLLILGRDDESLEQRELAISLDPLNPNTKLLYLGTLVQAGDNKKSVSLAEEALAANPKDISINGMLEIAAYKCKHYDKVIRAVKYSLPITIDEDDFKYIERIYSESGIVKAYEEILKHLEKYAENNYISFGEMAPRYIIANQPEKAMDWIEKGFESHDPIMTYITKSALIFDPLFGNPRFIAIVKKMNLPLPKHN
jgi:TolB-like protein